MMERLSSSGRRDGWTLTRLALIPAGDAGGHWPFRDQWVSGSNPLAPTTYEKLEGRSWKSEATGSLDHLTSEF